LGTYDQRRCVTVTTSTTSSTATVITVTSTANAYTYPAVNGHTVVDAGGVQFVIMCASDMTGGPSARQSVNNSFDDCVSYSDSNPYYALPTKGKQFMGLLEHIPSMLTHNRGANGVGSGFCTFKGVRSQGSQTFLGVPGYTSYNAAIKAVYYAPPPYETVTYTTSYPFTTTTVSTAVQTVTTSYPITQKTTSAGPGKLSLHPISPIPCPSSRRLLRSLNSGR
jgi:hypothetical protein